MVITALHDDDQHLTGYAKVTRDRTDLKGLEEAQDAFYAAFSHDFSTPVTAIKGYIDAIRGAETNARQFIDRVEASAEKLLDMVEGLVEFATRGPPTRPAARPRRHRPGRASAVHDLPTPSARPVQVRGRVALAWANGVAIYRVVTNLVVNALKYSPRDTAVEVDFGRAGPGCVRLTVTDQGRGIDPEDLATIFEEFARGRLAEDDGGTGLGLASVRELVDQRGAPS